MKRLLILLLLLLSLSHGLDAQTEPTKVTVQDDAKVGVLVTGEGNEINVTQNILPKSQQYQELQADSARLYKIIVEKNEALEAAADNKQLQAYIAAKTGMNAPKNIRMS